MTKITKITVVHRKFRAVKGGFNLVVQPQYKKVMKYLNEQIKLGKEITLNHTIISDDDKKWYDGMWYDKIEIEVND